jgi:hypothetical protein
MADEWRYSLHQRLAAHFGERGDALYSLGAGALAITVSAFAAFFSGQPNRRRVIHGVLITLDPNLTLTGTQHPAISGKRGKGESLIYAGFANFCNAQQQLTAHS